MKKQIKAIIPKHDYEALTEFEIKLSEQIQKDIIQLALIFKSIKRRKAQGKMKGIIQDLKVCEMIRKVIKHNKDVLHGLELVRETKKELAKTKEVILDQFEKEGKL